MSDFSNLTNCDESIKAYKMRIAIHGRYRSSSSNGVDRTIAGLAEAFSQDNHQVTIISAERPDRQNLEAIKSLGIRLVYCGSSLKDLVKNPVQWDAFDLVIFNSVFAWQAIYLSKQCVSPYLCIPNGGYFEGSIKNRSRFKKKIFAFLFERPYLERSAAVQALSEAESVAINAIAPRAAIIKAPNGAFPISFKSSYNPGRGSPRWITFVGRISVRHKGLDLLLPGLQMARNMGCDLKLNLVGPFERKQRRLLEGLIDKLGLVNHVRFHGTLYGEKKFQILKESHFFVHTSRWEGMPFAVIEAMQLGIPVVISKETNLSEFVAADDCGWVIRENSPEYIAASLADAYRTSVEELSEKGKRASEVVAQHLNWPRISRSILCQVNEVLCRNEKTKK